MSVAGIHRVLNPKPPKPCRPRSQLGLTEVPVIVAEQLTPAEADAFRIADNRTHDFTMWDFPELVQQLDELAEDFGDVLALADWEAITMERVRNVILERVRTSARDLRRPAR